MRRKEWRWVWLVMGAMRTFGGSGGGADGIVAGWGVVVGAGAVADECLKRDVNTDALMILEGGKGWSVYETALGCCCWLGVV